MIPGTKLFKRTNTGAVQIWWQELNEDGTGYRTVSGQVNGKLVYSEYTIAEAKNVGRSNETTPKEQALSEVASNYVKRKDRGYVEDISAVDSVEIFKPMLAHKYGDYPIQDYAKGYYSQPKLDGLRGIVTMDAAMSRNAKPFHTVGHIIEALQPFFEVLGTDTTFDGEFYNHDLRHDFNKIVSLVKKTKPTEADLAESAEKVQYWVYDIPSIDAPFAERWEILRQLSDIDPRIVVTPTERLQDQEHLDALFASYIEDEFEGQMVRLADSLYENKRSKNLLKRKEFMDDEFVLVDVLDGKGNRSGMAGRLVYETRDGKRFETGIRGNRAFYRDLLERKDYWIGKEATVAFFQYTPDGVPRFGVTKIIHETPRD